MSPSAPRPPPARIWRILLVFSLFPFLSRAEPTADRASLQSFLSSTRHDPRRVDWDTTNSSSTACLWRGVTCDATATAVVALRLPGTGLSGPIPPTTPLARLASLRYLSLRSNALSGPLPETLLSGSAIPGLHGLYLQENRFSGEIPPSVGRMRGILRLDLSGNNLSGGIPPGFGNLIALTGLFLQGNRLSGEIPGSLANLTALQEFNVSDNQLRGPIPQRLGTRFPASAFAGNVGLCGVPLPPCAATSTPGVPTTKPPTGGNRTTGRRKLSTAAIITIAVVGGALLLLALLAVLLLCCRLPQRLRSGTPKPAPGPAASPGARSGGDDTATTSWTSKDDPGGGGRLSSDKRNKLTFLDSCAGDWYSFDLEDLLRASAEVLGKGGLGTSYKAVLEEGATVVVKRLRGEYGAVGKADFEACMQAVARAGAGHQRNVLPLRAYYYSKDEKLLLFDYVPGGSLSATLHANRGTGRTPLEWPSRLRIALTAARGLQHLHATASLVHGNLKASNVLLRRDPDGAAAAVLADYALHPLFTASHQQRAGARTSGYRAPERDATAAPTPEADVYSYGVLVLELLTGRSPSSPPADQESVGGGGGGGPSADLPRWVRSVVREEWTAEVLDVDLVRYGSEEEMVRLLQVALACTEPVPAARPRLEDVVRTVQEVADAAAAAEGDDSGTGKAAAVLSSSDDPVSEAHTPPAARTP